jgi:colanic acid/amylovoran biosynthesis glycosyltransferase
VGAELRIAYLTSAFGRPGDTFIRNEVNELRRLGATVDTYSIRRPSLDVDAEEDIVGHQQATDYILEAGWPALALGTIRMAATHPLRFARALGLAWQTSSPGIRAFGLQLAYVIEAGYLASRMLERKTQIVHNHIGENSASVAMLAAEMSGLPFSQTIHGPYIFYAPRRWALGEKLSRAAFTACISHFCRSQCLMFAPKEAWPRLHVVRCSVQPLFVEEPPQRRTKQSVHFLCVGRLCVEKGQTLLMDAASRLIESLPDIRLSIVGDGPDREPLERKIEELHLAGHVRILGWRSSKEIREMLTDATALVISSLAEGLPIVAMEALASGCPVIATNIAAMSELIEAGRSGWLIPAGSVDDLAAAMKDAARCDDAQLKQMGEIGRQRVLELHHPCRQTEKLLELFEAAVS